MTSLTHTCNPKLPEGASDGTTCLACDVTEVIKWALAGYGPGGWKRDRVERQLDRIKEALAAQLSPIDRDMLESCARAVQRLDETGQTAALRNRVRLLADWQRSRSGK